MDKPISLPKLAAGRGGVRGNDWPSITEFYCGRDIFITGATGFMGKCLLEKIIRSIPGDGKVYVLVRPKKGKSVEERGRDLSNNEIFSHIRKTQPDKLQRLVPIEGDICKTGLGLSEQDRRTMTDNVSVIFHLAATVRFDESMKKSLQINVLAVREIIKLAKETKNLQSLVHVSTAYCNCNIESIDEVIYPATTINYADLLNSMSWMTDEQYNLLMPTLLQGRPNTYTLTKALAENLLEEEAQDLPVAIIRPSIIGAALNEPLPGYINGLHGATGIFIGIGKGLVKVLPIDWSSTADIIPVDFVNNMLISIGWVTAMNRRSSSMPPIVYHCTTGSLNPVTWGQLSNNIIRSYTENPFDNIFRRPGFIKCRPLASWRVWQFLLHYIPGYMVDWLLGVAGKKRRIVTSYKLLDANVDLVRFFTTRSWQWSHSNYDKLLNLLSEEDRKLFDFNVKSFKWDTYLSSFCMGTKKYLLKDDLSNLHKARKQIKRHRNIRYMFCVLLVLLSGHVLFLRSQLAKEVWYKTLNTCLKILRKLMFHDYSKLIHLDV